MMAIFRFRTERRNLLEITGSRFVLGKKNKYHPAFIITIFIGQRSRRINLYFLNKILH